MSEILAVDIGTSRTKAAVFDRTLRRTEIESTPNHAVDPAGQVDLDVLLSSVLSVVGGLARRVSLSAVSVCSVTSILGHVFCGGDGSPLGPAWAYSDGRSTDECLEIADALERFGGTGHERPVAPELLAPRLLWLARRRQSVAGSLSKVLGIKDWIVAQLTGIQSTDFSHRDYSLLLDSNDQVIEPVVALLCGSWPAGVSVPPEVWARGILPRAQAAHRGVGKLRPGLARKLGLSPEVMVSSGSTDGTAAMYGAGILAEGNATAVFGTTDVVMRAMPALGASMATGAAARAGLSRNAAILPGFELVGGSTSASGRILDWFSKLRGIQIDEHRWESVVPGAAGVRVAPGFGGERAPYGRPEATGGIQGLSPATTGPQIARAIVEASTYRTAELIETVDRAGEPLARLTVGGGAGGLEVDRLRAAIIPVPIFCADDPELSLRGAAMYGAGVLATAHGGLSDGDQEVARLSAEICGRSTLLAADEDLVRVYATLYREWLKWYGRYREHLL